MFSHSVFRTNTCLSWKSFDRSGVASNRKTCRQTKRKASEDDDSSEMDLSLDDILALTEAADDAVKTDNVSSLAKWFKKDVFDEKYLSLHYGASRSKWMGANTVPPSYLRGTVAGDYGFDPAGFSSDPSQFQRMREAEIMHGRWAMLGLVGCTIPEAFHIGFSAPGGEIESVWFKVLPNGSSSSADSSFDVSAVIQQTPALAALFAMLAVIALGEVFRAKEDGIERIYPGGAIFDPLGLAADAECAKDLKVREIKNGRIAMTAMLGIFVQAAITGQGPIQNLKGHVVDPIHNSIISSF